MWAPVVSIMILAGALIAFPDDADARDYPWCLIEQADDTNAVTICSYETLAQCRASQAGGGTTCEKNPYYWWDKPGFPGYQGSGRQKRRH